MGAPVVVNIALGFSDRAFGYEVPRGRRGADA